jgi:hypothetical protein
MNDPHITDQTSKEPPPPHHTTSQPNQPTDQPTQPTNQPTHPPTQPTDLRVELPVAEDRRPVVALRGRQLLQAVHRGRIGGGHGDDHGGGALEQLGLHVLEGLLEGGAEPGLVLVLWGEDWGLCKCSRSVLGWENSKIGGAPVHTTTHPHHPRDDTTRTGCPRACAARAGPTPRGCPPSPPRAPLRRPPPRRWRATTPRPPPCWAGGRAHRPETGVIEYWCGEWEGM